MKKILQTIAVQAWPACTQITAAILVIVGISVYASGGDPLTSDSRPYYYFIWPGPHFFQPGYTNT